jgi:hypothetical protein
VTTGGEIVAFKQGVSVAATTAAGIIKVYRANQTVSKTELQLLRVRAEEAVALARVAAIAHIGTAVLEQIIQTSRLIETLPANAISYPLAMDALETMSRKLRRVIDDF